MAILAYDDVMLREPRLLVPGQAPLGKVAINAEHPSGKGLSIAYAPWRGLGVNLVNGGTKLTPTGLESSQRQGGLGAKLDDGSSDGVYCGNLYWHNAWTIMVCAVVDTFTNGRSLWQPYTPAYAEAPIFELKGPNDIQFGGSFSTGYDYKAIGGASIVVGKPFVAILSWSQYTSGTMSGYLGSVKNTFTGKTWATTSAYDSVIGNVGTSVNRGFPGVLLFVCRWERCLPDGEAWSLMRDPYQFLIPA